MNKKERLTNLKEILKLRGYVSIRELSELLKVSEMTIRRDIKILEKNQIAENITGTIVYNPAHSGDSDKSDYNLYGVQQQYNSEKEAIGEFAASLVEMDDILIVDTGSTTEKIIKHLPIDKHLTVLCYNINILMELRRNPGVQMLFAGGIYHPNTQMFVSSEGIDFIRNIRAKKVFLSAAGVHNELGLTCMHNYEVLTKQTIMKSSVEKVLVADSTKFGVVRSAYFSELTDIDTIITDNGLSREWKERISELDITLHIV